MSLRTFVPRRYERLIYSGRVLKNHQDALEVIASFFNASRMPKINLIDVGCYKGYFLDRFQSLVRKPIFSVGIDPVRWEHVLPYSAFIEGAVTNQPEGSYDFYEYNDPMCNSLKKMNVDKITHDPAERSERYFVERHIETLTNVRSIEAAPLAALIQRLKMENEILHFLKIDAQGCDLEVFLSLHEFIPRCLFVQLESLASKNKDIALYENQALFEEEKPVLEKYGFKLFSMTDYGQTGASPEADVIFLNLPLFNQLHISSSWRRFWARALSFVKC